MKKIIILTGANGHVGNNIVKMLVDKDYEVRGLVLSKSNVSDFKNIKYYEGNYIQNMHSIH
ncbi:MAG: NAD-dependent epimerase/dehydratase family protein [Firmicutes bacterium]|uniref:NAD-dependent epimerase/dehydratase family protein n=1 Tax=Candidatus Onthovivens merdipullorum TaxID=2840889 RepID=A0A9D9DLY2_9BACL|nr:NAD-dependent epimerase/dehydratase family protein [Candidatus Onthovivens merdipullorum]